MTPSLFQRKLHSTTKYDGEDNLVEYNCGLGVTTYGYDGDGRRVKKVSGGLTTIYVCNVSGQLAAEYSSQGPTGTGISYLTADHLGSTRIVTDANRSVKARRDYLPFGEEIEVGYGGRGSILGYGATENTRQRFTGKERDNESNLDYFGARYFSGAQGRFTSSDPGNASVHPINPQSWNGYAYVNNRTLSLIDPNGLEPVKAQAGTIHGFAQNMNGTPHKVGQARGADAARALYSLGETRNLGPANTAVFNMSANRYVYTANGGWVDMVHFVFYAGRAARYKAEGNLNPVGEAAQDGYAQEWMDTFRAPWSAYSYEDLPSDLYGAIFGAQFFDPTSSLTLAEQIEVFMSYLSPLAPTNAPNYAALPDRDSRKPPMVRNDTTDPMFTLWWSRLMLDQHEPEPHVTVTIHY